MAENRTKNIENLEKKNKTLMENHQKKEKEIRERQKDE